MATIDKDIISKKITDSLWGIVVRNRKKAEVLPGQFDDLVVGIVVQNS